MSHSARPDLPAFDELQLLVRHLAEELSSFRRRAMQAEARVKELEKADAGRPVSPSQARALEKENAVLRQRLETATERTRAVLDRIRFVRQQHAPGKGADR